MKEPPAHTFANLLGTSTPSPANSSPAWNGVASPPTACVATFRPRRATSSTNGSSLVNYVSPDTKSDDMLVDESAGAIVQQLGDALTEMEVNGHFFGDCSLTLVLFDRDPRALSNAAAAKPTNSFGRPRRLLR